MAVKGLGGYHLACDAARRPAVAELRRRKGRGDKPFAVMARDLDVARATLVDIGDAEAAAARPARAARSCCSAPAAGRRAARRAVAPGNPDLGVMLPYTPLHHLLLGLPGDAPGPDVLVMTSATSPASRSSPTTTRRWPGSAGSPTPG